MATEKSKSVIAASDKLNRHGYRIATAGIVLEAFKANPVMLFQHGRSSQYSRKGDQNLPIGKWENMRIENGQLMADPVFDLGDEFAKEVARKWEGGFLNAVSIGFNFLEWSEDPIHLVQGQTRPTVTKAELLEISIVDIPADANAVRILNANDEKDPLSMLPLLQSKTPQTVNQKSETKMDNAQLCLSLGLPANATGEQIAAAIAKLTNAPKVEAALSLGRTKGIVNDENAAQMRTIVEASPDAFKLAWEAVPTPKATETLAPVGTAPQPQGLAAALREVAAQNQPVQTVAQERLSWGFDEWRKNDWAGFLALEYSNKPLYDKLTASVIRNGRAVNPSDDNVRFQ
jgi:hypothetical protein